MKLEINQICDEKKCKFELIVEGKKPQILEKVALRFEIGRLINKMGKRRIE